MATVLALTELIPTRAQGHRLRSITPNTSPSSVGSLPFLGKPRAEGQRSVSPPSSGCQAAVSREPRGSAVSHSVSGVWGASAGGGEVGLGAPPPISPKQGWPLPPFPVCVG